MGKAIGIDLGTTFTVAAAVGAQGRPSVIDSSEARPLIRSVVSWVGGDERTAGEIAVGDPAWDNWSYAPKDTIISIKRLIGRGFADKKVQEVRSKYDYEIVEPSDGTKDSLRVLMGGKEYSPVDISAIILRKVKRDVEARLGEEVTDAVITVPAYFNQAQKAATRLAAQKAGLLVIQIIDEPTSAAIAYGLDAEEESEELKYILVYDLGGGTFDISVLIWHRGSLVPLMPEGDMWLGGDNFDQVLVDSCVEEIKSEHKIDPTKQLDFMIELKRACHKAKEHLSSIQSANISLPPMLRDEDGNFIRLKLRRTREQFEEMIRPLVERTFELARKALANAELDTGQISTIIMAGNSTLVPMVQRAAEEMFGPEKVSRRMQPKQCVALGAAMQAARLYGKLVCQAPDPEYPDKPCGWRNAREAIICERCKAPLRAEVSPQAASGPEPITIGPWPAPFSYGIQTAGDKYTIFIRKGEPYPTPLEKRIPQTFYTRVPGQRLIDIPIFAGEDETAASANEKQGEAGAVLPPHLPIGTPIRVKMWLDSDGVFDLSAFLEESGKDLKPWIMKGEEDQKALELLQDAEEQYQDLQGGLSSDEKGEFERARNEALECMREKQFNAALERAEQYKEKLVQRKKSVDPRRMGADNVISYARFVVDRYHWIFNASQVLALNQLIARALDALKGDDASLIDGTIAELKAALDHIPTLAQTLFNMLFAIRVHIRPYDAAKAAELDEELDTVEEALKAGSALSQDKLRQLIAKIEVAVDQLPADRGISEVTCPNRECGHKNKAGTLKCKVCGTPLNLLETVKNAASSGLIKK